MLLAEQSTVAATPLKAPDLASDISEAKSRFKEARSAVIASRSGDFGDSGWAFGSALMIGPFDYGREPRPRDGRASENGRTVVRLLRRQHGGNDLRQEPGIACPSA